MKNRVAMLMVFLPAIESQTQKTLKISLAPSRTPILSVLKPDGPYYLVQNLLIINMADLPIHPVVPNLCSLHSQILSSISHFTVLDIRVIYLSFLYTYIHMISLPSPEWTLTPEQCLSYLTFSVLTQNFLELRTSFVWPGSGH